MGRTCFTEEQQSELRNNPYIQKISTKSITYTREFKEIIARDNNLLNISWLCETAGVSRSGYYRWLNTVDTRDEKEELDKRDVVMIRVPVESICAF